MWPPFFVFLIHCKIRKVNFFKGDGGCGLRFLSFRRSTMIVARRSPVARSLGRSLARSLARSIDHSLARSLARSIARSLTDMCSLQSQYKGAAFGRHHKGGRAAFGRAAPFVVSFVLALKRAHVSERTSDRASERSSERVIDRASDRPSERATERATGERRTTIIVETQDFGTARILIFHDLEKQFRAM